MRLLLPILGFSAALLAGTTVDAATVKVDYSIKLAGLTLGEADLEGRFEGDRYSMVLKGRLTGLAGAFSSGGRGSATARGTFAGSRLSPSGFSATGASSTRERTVQLGIANNAVTAVAIEPPFEEGEERVPVTEAQKRGILDPLSAVVAIASSRARADDPQACNRTIPVFDGTQRFDIALSYAETKQVRKPGYSGPVLVCDVRYTPIAGHRTDRPSVRFMTDNRDMSVWLAPVEGTRVLIPLRISVKTMLGTSVVEAERWAADSGEGRALTR